MICGDQPPTVLIVEPDPSGHHLSYVGILVDSCRARGERAVVLTTPAVLESVEWKTLLEPRGLEVSIRPASAFELPNIAEAAIHAQASMTILPDGDRYLLPILLRGWHGSGLLSVLVLRADGQPRNSPWLKRVRGAAKKTLAFSAGLRQRVRISALRSPLVRRCGPLRWAADPITIDCTENDIRKMRERLNAEGNKYWFGVFGIISSRKNLPLVVESILGLPEVGLLIAGSVDADVAESSAPLLAQFAASGGDVRHLPGTLTDVEFDSAVSAVDCVIVAYTNEGSSGIVLKAAAAGRRLILAGSQSLKRDAARLGAQAVWSPLDVEALGKATRQVRNLPEPDTKLNLGTEDFVRALTWPARKY